MEKVDMCKHYEWNFKLIKNKSVGYPKCMKNRKASLKCHSENLSCPDYEQSESYYNEIFGGDKYENRNCEKNIEE